MEGITGHLIDENLEIKSIQIALRKIVDHTGKEIARIVYLILEEFNLINKIGWFVTDNASNVIKFVQDLQVILQNNGYAIDVSESRVRCMCHVLQLVTMAFLNGLESTVDDEDEEINQKKISYRSVSNRKSLDDDKSEYNTISKIRNIVINIKKSPQRLEKWYDILRLCNVSKKKIPLDNDTRWRSLFQMIINAIKLKKEINIYCNSFTDMEKNKISDKNWKNLEFVAKFLAKFTEFTDFFEGESYPTIFFVIDAYNQLFDSLDELDNKKLKIKTALDNTYAKLRIYYKRTDYSRIFLIATILSPCYKMEYFTNNEWEEENVKEIRNL